jgi:hypothetical protein
LRIAVAVGLTEFEGVVPALAGGAEQIGGTEPFVNAQRANRQSLVFL